VKRDNYDYKHVLPSDIARFMLSLDNIRKIFIAYASKIVFIVLHGYSW